MDEVTKLKLKMTSLSERFSMRIAQYEDEIAEMRADATMLVQSLQEEVDRLRGQLDDKTVQEDSKE